jgi:hypothetical protein
MERSEHENRVFEPGMVVCVEVWAGLRGGVEDMYLVRSEGLVRMTTLSRQLQATGERDL